MKSIGPEDFFKKVAVNAGIMDLQVVRDVFYATVKTISQELKICHTIKLPDFGEFYLHLHKARKFLDMNTKILRQMPPTLTVKFSPDYKIKAYFHEFGKDRTVL